MHPSQLPSMIPSLLPSPLSSTIPSTLPSIISSRDPTGLLSYQPSQTSSRKPSKYPSFSPIFIPSNLPSINTSMFPSIVLSYLPSRNPSKVPSKSPKHTPSTLPSSQPSKMPDVVPSTKPSKEPSYSPSMRQSIFPSMSKSKFPSYTPSSDPSDLTTLLPSDVPTYLPSVQASNHPSIVPSNKPSTFWTKYPSAQPTYTCHDVSSYKNRIGRTCSEHKDTPTCLSYLELGFSKEDVHELLVNCPQTCGLCDSMHQLDSQFISLKGPTFYPSSISPSKYPSTRPNDVQSLVGASSTKAPSKFSSLVSSDAFRVSVSNNKKCFDNFDFRSLKGLKCSDLKIVVTMMPCNSFGKLGMDNIGVITVMAACPETCGYCATGKYQWLYSNLQNK